MEVPRKEELPGEVWLHILGYLHPSDWCRLMLVDKRWNALSNDNALWGIIIPPSWKEQVAATLNQSKLAEAEKQKQQTKETINQPNKGDFNELLDSISDFFVPAESRKKQTKRPQLTIVKELVGVELVNQCLSWKQFYFNWCKREATQWLNSKKTNTTGILSRDAPYWVGERPFFGKRTHVFSFLPERTLASYDVQINIVLVGPAQAGKSSFCARVAHDTFDQKYLSTVGVDFSVKFAVFDGKVVRFHFWDTGGDIKFRSITPSYLKAARGILLCFDISDRESFEDMKANWLPLLANSAPQHVPWQLVGLKSDLEAQVTESDIIDLLNEWQKEPRLLQRVQHCSAKDGGEALEQALFGLVLSVCDGHIWVKTDPAGDGKNLKDKPLYLPGKRQWNNLIQQIQKEQEKSWGKAVDLLSAPKDMCHNS